MPGIIENSLAKGKRRGTESETRRREQQGPIGEEDRASGC